MAALTVLPALLVALLGVQATPENKSKRQVVGPEVLPNTAVRIPFTMCQANLNDLVPCTVSPLAPNCFQMKGTCCRGSCVCNSYPNPCIADGGPYLTGRRKRAALESRSASEPRGCKRSCREKCRIPYCVPGTSRSHCKSACIELCLEQCNDSLMY